MVPGADGQAGRADRQRQPLAVSLLDLRFAGDGFVHCDVDEVKRTAMPVRLIILKADFIARDRVGDGEQLGLTAPGIRRAKVSALEPGGVKLLLRGEIDETEVVAEPDREQKGDGEGAEQKRPTLQAQHFL